MSAQLARVFNAAKALVDSKEVILQGTLARDLEAAVAAVTDRGGLVLAFLEDAQLIERACRLALCLADWAKSHEGPKTGAESAGIELAELLLLKERSRSNGRQNQADPEGTASMSGSAVPYGSVLPPAELAARAATERIEHGAGCVRPFVRELRDRGCVTAQEWAIAMNSYERQELLSVIENDVLFEHLLHCASNVDANHPGTYNWTVVHDLVPEARRRQFVELFRAFEAYRRSFAKIYANAANGKSVPETCEHGFTREVDQYGTPICDRCLAPSSFEGGRFEPVEVGGLRTMDRVSAYPATVRVAEAEKRIHRRVLEASEKAHARVTVLEKAMGAVLKELEDSQRFGTNRHMEWAAVERALAILKAIPEAL